MIQLVLLRHGESVSNRDGYFTGWNDVALSQRGEHQAEQAGRLLKEMGCEFDICFTSELRRATDTSRILLSSMGLDRVTTRQSWRLNERHYGALEGVHRINAIGKFGIWPVLGSQLRFTAIPPPLRPDDARCPGNQLRYSDVDKNELPLSESMQQTFSRVLPYWHGTIAPELLRGKRVLVVSHRHVLRSLIMQLDGLSVSQLMKVTIATGRPLVYNLDHKLDPFQRYYADRRSA